MPADLVGTTDRHWPLQPSRWGICWGLCGLNSASPVQPGGPSLFSVSSSHRGPVWWGPCVVGTLRGGDPAWWGPAWWGPCVVGTLRGGDLHGGDPARLPGLLPAQLHLSVSVSEGLSLILCLSLSFCLCLILRLQVLGADCPCPRGVISAHLEDPLRQFKMEEKSFRGFLRASCCPV